MRSYLDRAPVAGAKARVLAKKPAEEVVIREFDLSQLPAVFRRLPIVGQFSWSLSMGGHPSASLQIIATYQTIAIVRHLFVRDRALTLFGIGFKVNSYSESQGNYGLAAGGMYFCSISLGGKWESEIDRDRFLDPSDDAQQKSALLRAAEVSESAQEAIDLTQSEAFDAILDGINSVDRNSLLIKTPENEAAKRANDPCYKNRALLGDPDTLNPNNLFVTGDNRNQSIDPQCAQYVTTSSGSSSQVPITPPINIPGSITNSSTNNTASPTGYLNPNYTADGSVVASNVPTTVASSGNTNRNPNQFAQTITQLRSTNPIPPTVQAICYHGIIAVPLINTPPILLPPSLTGTKGSQLQATTSSSDRPPSKTVVRISQYFNPESCAIHGLYPDYSNPNGITTVSVNGGKTWNFSPKHLFPVSNNGGISIYCETSYGDKYYLSSFPDESAALPDFETVLPNFETPSPTFPPLSECEGGLIGYSSKYDNYQLQWDIEEAAANQQTLNLLGFDPFDLNANLAIGETASCANRNFLGLTAFDPSQYVNPSDNLVAKSILDNSYSSCNQFGAPSTSAQKNKPRSLQQGIPRFVRQPMVPKKVKGGSPNPSTPPGTGLLHDTGLNWDTGGLTKTYSERTTINGLPTLSLDETWGYHYTGSQISSGTEKVMAGSAGAFWGRVKREVTEYHYDPSTGYALGSTTRGFQSVRFQQENPSEPETLALKNSTDPTDAKRMALYEPRLVPILAQQRNKIYTYNAFYRDAHQEKPPYEIFKRCNRDGTSAWGYVAQPEFVASAFVSQESFLRRSYIRTDNPDFDPKEGGKPRYLAAGEETWNQVRHEVSPAASNARTPPDDVNGINEEITWKSQPATEDTYTTFNSRQSNGGPNFANSAFDETFSENIGRPSPAARLAATYKLEKPDNPPINNDYEKDDSATILLSPNSQLTSCWVALSNTNPPVLETSSRGSCLPSLPQIASILSESSNQWNRPANSYDPLRRSLKVAAPIPPKSLVPPKVQSTQNYEYYICSPGYTFSDPIGGSLSFPTAASLSQALLGAATLLKVGDIQGTLSTKIKVPFNPIIRPFDKVRFSLGGTSYRRIVKSVSCTINFKGLVDGLLKVEWEATDLDLGIDRTIPIYPVAKEPILNNYSASSDSREGGNPEETPLEMIFVSQIIEGLGEDVDFTTNRIF